MSLDDVLAEIDSWMKETSKDFVLELITIPLLKSHRKDLEIRSATMASKVFQRITEEIDGLSMGGNQTEITRVHNQRLSNLCWAFAIISVLRSELMRILKHLLREKYGNALEYTQKVGELKKLLKTTYTHREMLIGFLFCAYPRSMDSLPTDEGSVDYDKQFAKTEKAVTRLVLGTVFKGPGWKSIHAIGQVFEKFGFVAGDFGRRGGAAYHPNSPNRGPGKTFDALLKDKRTVIGSIHFE